MQTDKKTKVLYVITKGVWGGAQKYVYSLATNLPKDRFEPIVVCGEGGVLKEKLEQKNIRVIEINNLKRDISFLSEIKSFIKLFGIIKKEKPDVIHLNSPKASGLGAMAGRFLGIKVIVFTAHGWTFNEDRNVYSKFIIWLLSFITVILSHKVIVIATKERAQTLSMPFVCEDKVELIRNGVENTEYLDRDTARKALLPELYSNLESNTIWLGTMAELHKNKGYKYTIEALSKITKPFVFIAIGEGEERSNLENLVQKHRLEEKVFLIGFKDKSAQYLKAFDIFTLTSIKEGLPYTLIEAGFAGIPVVASNVGGIPDIVDDKINGVLTESKNVSEIKNAIENLIENSETRNDFGNKLKEKVEKEFSLDQMLEKTLILYVN